MNGKEGLSINSGNIVDGVARVGGFHKVEIGLGKGGCGGVLVEGDICLPSQRRTSRMGWRFSRSLYMANTCVTYWYRTVLNNEIEVVLSSTCLYELSEVNLDALVATFF